MHPVKYAVHTRHHSQRCDIDIPTIYGQPTVVDLNTSSTLRAALGLVCRSPRGHLMSSLKSPLVCDTETFFTSPDFENILYLVLAIIRGKLL